MAEEENSDLFKNGVVENPYFSSNGFDDTYLFCLSN
jgi:hypothetical protein